jgi:hypothetical protein
MPGIRKRREPQEAKGKGKGASANDLALGGLWDYWIGNVYYPLWEQCGTARQASLCLAAGV